MFSIEERKPGYFLLELTRPPFNTLDAEFARELIGKLDELARSDIHLLHVRSTARAFCGGATLSMLRAWHGAEDPAGMQKDMEILERLNATVEAFPAITLAEMGGAAVGAGLGFALSFDLRIAAHEAKFGVPEAPVGTLPAGGALRRLSLAVGQSNALRLFATAELVSGEEAARIGIAQWATSRDDLARHTDEIVAAILGNPASALRIGKEEIRHGRPGSDIDAMRDVGNDRLARERFAAFLDSREDS